MLFRAAFLSAVALLGINQAVGSALESRSAEIAKNSCLCHPNRWPQHPILMFPLQTWHAIAPTIVATRMAQVASTITPTMTLLLVVSNASSSGTQVS